MSIVNDHNVYILGAGFSKQAELPLISDFLCVMRESHSWLMANKRAGEAGAIERVLNFRLKSAAAAYWIQMDLENIEELFSLASATKEQISADIRLAIAATLDFARQTKKPTAVTVTLESEQGRKVMGHWGQYDASGVGLIDPYRFYVAKLLGLLPSGAPKGRNTFISFNYDTVLEENLDALRVPFSYGLDGDSVEYPNREYGNDKSQKVSVLKVHGSINWARNAEDAKKTDVFPSYAQLRKAKLSPQLIPPTWRKSYQRQFSSGLDQAAQMLKSATRVVVIGFSMPQTDIHFKYMLAAGFSENVSLRNIIFVNPDSGELKIRSASHFKEKYIADGRITFRPLTLEQYMGDWKELSIIDREQDYSVNLYTKRA